MMRWQAPQHIMQDEALQMILAALGGADGKTRIVGGAVRNLILNMPVQDIDLATEFLPDEVMARCKTAGIRTIPTGVEHGTVTAIIEGRTFEITTLRQDVETTGRHAVVNFGTDWVEDARRRDFTMNALYVHADGTLFDPLSGFEDVIARRVRFIGDAAARIQEDYLRILRYFRFVAQYGAESCPSETIHTIAANINGLRQLSVERVWCELKKILACASPQLMHDMMAVGVFSVLGLGVFYFPSPIPGRRWHDRSGAKGVTDEGEFKKTLTRPSGTLSQEWEREYLAPLFLHFIWLEEDAQRIADRLKLSNAERKTFLLWAKHVWRLRDAPSIQQAREVLYAAGQSDYADILTLASIRWHWELTPELSNIPTTHPIPPKPFTSEDFIKQGLSGAALGVALKQAEAEWIQNQFTESHSENS